MKKNDETRITVRFPSELIQEIKPLARQHGRSLNSEIVWALRYYLRWQKGEEKQDEKL